MIEYFIMKLIYCDTESVCAFLVSGYALVVLISLIVLHKRQHSQSKDSTQLYCMLIDP